VTTAQGAPGGTATLAGRTVARIGFGAMQLERADRDAAVTVLRRAVEQGVNHIDTAQFYGPGTSNTLIRAALHPYAEDLTLVSKVGAEHRDGGLTLAQRPEQLRAAVEANLTTLGTDHLAVVNLRRADAPPGLLAEGDQIVPIDDQLAVMLELREEGKIGAIGLSHVNAAQLSSALPVGIACVQNAYSLLDRTSEPVLDLCREHAIAWVPYFPLGSAFPQIPKVTDHPEVITTAKSLNATPAQVALSWLLASYDQTLLIPGTADPSHLDENLAAGGVRLTPEQVKALDGIAS